MIAILSFAGYSKHESTVGMQGGARINAAFRGCAFPLQADGDFAGLLGIGSRAASCFCCHTQFLEAIPNSKLTDMALSYDK